ncbi:GNAT family N-acetyltransferase [Rhizobium leguminosarum]|nr:GNAT family N-acetyltransferase [Rhizobium leguminosarum]
MVSLKGAGVHLRPASPDDAEARFSLGTDADISRMFGVSQSDVKPITRDAAEEWAQGQAQNPYAWMIELEQRLIGEIKLHSLNFQDRRASMAVAIYDPPLLGKGLGSEAIRLLLQHAFTELKLHRIGIRVLAYNERAIRAYQKCGFVVEGRERETAFVDGKWHDDLMMGLLSTEFQDWLRSKVRS